MKGFHTVKSDECIRVKIDTGIFRLSAIKKAAYRLGSHYYIQLEKTTDKYIDVILQPKDAKILQNASGVFRNEILDQELREIVAEETKLIRDLLLAQVFSSVSLTDEMENVDYHSDPKKILK